MLFYLFFLFVFFIFILFLFSIIVFQFAIACLWFLFYFIFYFIFYFYFLIRLFHEDFLVLVTVFLCAIKYSILFQLFGFCFLLLYIDFHGFWFPFSFLFILILILIFVFPVVFGQFFTIFTLIWFYNWNYFANCIILAWIGQIKLDCVLCMILMVSCCFWLFWMNVMRHVHVRYMNVSSSSSIYLNS